MPENKYNKSPSSNEYNNIFGTAAHEKQKLRRHILSSRMTKGNHKFQNCKDNERKTRAKEIQHKVWRISQDHHRSAVQRHHEI